MDGSATRMSRRARRGHDHACVMIWRSEGAQEASGVDEVGVDRSRALEGVEEEDEEHRAPGQHDLGEHGEAEDIVMSGTSGWRSE